MTDDAPEHDGSALAATGGVCPPGASYLLTPTAEASPLRDLLPAFTTPRGGIGYHWPDPDAPPGVHRPPTPPAQRGARLLRWMARPRLRLRTRLARRWCGHPGIPDDNWSSWECRTCGFTRRGEEDRWWDEDER